MKFKWTLRSSIMTPLIAVATIISAGGGHGSNVPMLVCYPIIFLIEKLRQGDILTWIVMIAQFPVYGLLVDVVTNQRIKGIVIASIVTAHLVQVKVAWDRRKGDQSTVTFTPSPKQPPRSSIKLNILNNR